jgi:hypothetical protein
MKISLDAQAVALGVELQVAELQVRWHWNLFAVQTELNSKCKQIPSSRRRRVAGVAQQDDAEIWTRKAGGLGDTCRARRTTWQERCGKTGSRRGQSGAGRRRQHERGGSGSARGGRARSDRAGSDK